MSASFTRVFLLMLSGPLVWAGHFLFVYGVTGVMCARPAMLDASMGPWIVGSASLVCIAAIVAILVGMRKSVPRAGEPGFVPAMTCMLALLSVLAIVWETLPAFIVPICG